jgi:hypothetical protein
MRFTSWLWEQLDAGGPSSVFAKICWDDVNNGCAHVKFSANEWLSHFKDKHSEKIDLLTELLLNTYLEYMGESKRGKNL